MDTAQIVAKLDIPGLVLLLCGAGLGFFGHKLVSGLFPRQGAKPAVAIRFIGLAMAFIGALILLDVFA